MIKTLFKIFKIETPSIAKTKRKQHGKRKYWSIQVNTYFNLKEDNIIKSLVVKYGLDDWSLISRELSKLSDQFYRNSKQCRERYIKN